MSKTFTGYESTDSVKSLFELGEEVLYLNKSSLYPTIEDIIAKGEISSVKKETGFNSHSGSWVQYIYEIKHVTDRFNQNIHFDEDELIKNNNNAIRSYILGGIHALERKLDLNLDLN